MAFRKLFFKRVNESRSNFLLAEGDIALDESTFKLFRGDGTTVGGVAISGLGGVESLSEDTSPQLGGDLDTNGNSIISASNANINIVPNGTGDVTLQTDTVQIGDSNTDATITTNGTGDLTLNTNSGTDSGSIVIADAANGNITITPNGSGQVVIDGLSFPTADGSANQVLQTDGSGNLSFATISTGGLGNVVEDTTPQLGGDLDTNGNKITFDDGSASASYIGFGAADDLKIFHNGSHSIIRETGTGSLYVQSDNNVILGKDSGSETMVKGIADGAVELYYDNVKKLETTATGIAVTGTITGLTSISGDVTGSVFADDSTVLVDGINATLNSSALTKPILFLDNEEAQFGTDNDMQIRHSGISGLIKNSTGTLVIQGPIVRIQDAGSSQSAFSAADGIATLYHTNTAVLNTTAGGIQIVQGTEEAFHTVTGASGVTALDCANGHIFYKTGCTGDITANFTNLVLTQEYATNLTVIINQGATPYEVTAVQIGGSAQTINWQGGSQPTGNANGIDAFSFTILNDGGTYVVLGQMVDFT